MKNVIITGASRGIGKELVLQMLSKNHNVFAVARNQELLQEIKSPNYHYAVCDLKNEEEVKHTFSQLPFEKVDVHINNAGLLIKKPFSKFTLQDFIDSFKVNYYAPAQIIQLLEKVFSPHAHIVNISTIGAIQGSVKFPELSVYGGTKASLIHLTEILAEEWKDKSISINCLALGAVQTEMLAEAFPNYQAPITAKEMAEYIAEFALEKGKYFNGKVLQVSTTTP